MHSWRNLALSFTIYSRLYKPRLIANVFTYINVKNCSLSTTYNGEMTHRKQQK